MQRSRRPHKSKFSEVDPWSVFFNNKKKSKVEIHNNRQFRRSKPTCSDTTSDGKNRESNNQRLVESPWKTNISNGLRYLGRTIVANNSNLFIHQVSSWRSLFATCFRCNGVIPTLGTSSNKYVRSQLVLLQRSYSHPRHVFE